MATFENNMVNVDKFMNRVTKEDKFITALFYDGDNSREDFDLTTLAVSQAVDDEDEIFINDKKRYTKQFIEELAERFINRFGDDLADFSEIYILGRLDLDKNRTKDTSRHKEPVNVK